MSRQNQDKVTENMTQNMLILELSTMVVAIALALNSQNLTKVDIFTIMGFVAMTSLVLWFWWFYVVDRLTFPLKSLTFPFKDVLLLLFITLIPLVMRSRNSIYDNALFGAIFLIWAWLEREYITQHSSSKISYEEAINIKVLKRIFINRIMFGFLFFAGIFIGYYSNHAGFAYFTLATLTTIIYGTISSMKREIGLRKIKETLRSYEKS